jgi:16S rRNA processing protein RimM
LTDKQTGGGANRATRPTSSPPESRALGSKSTPAKSTVPGRPKRPKPRYAARPEQGKPLVETTGPEPATPPAETRLAVGVIVGAHGVRGELKLKLTTDDPERLSDVKSIYIGDDGSSRKLLGVRFHGGLALLRIGGVNNPEQANQLRGEWVRISGQDARPLDEGEFFYYQLVGLTAFDEAGVELGTLVDIIETGTNDVFVIKSSSGEEMLVPNHPDFVPAIEPDKGRITVRPLIYA